MGGYILMSEKLKIRPYARLITMLGDQLIKNELIALVELIKNSYDADAPWVKVSFCKFGPNFEVNDNSKIIIEDAGCGMDAEILKKHWLNPATPDKLKRMQERKTTQRGRILQGEKGIGRFAVFKLGRNIKITTRRQKINSIGEFIDEGEAVENILTYNFSKYDNDFLVERGEEKELFLDDLEVNFEERVPEDIVKRNMTLGTNKIERKPYGTIIEVTDLKSKWTPNRVERIQNEVGKLQPIFSKNQELDFGVWIYKDNDLHPSSDRYKDQLQRCLDEKSVLKITDGHYDESINQFRFQLNGREQRLDFQDPDINGLKLFRDYFKDSNSLGTECGSFNFEFYVFDFNSSIESQSKYNLDSEEKAMIKEHRIYLYRDGIRVMPYGDPDDDWLRVDITRGTISAREFLSNDQVVGCIYITQRGNPSLKDKTNREGLIEEGKALGDFIFLLQLVLKYIRNNPYSKYLLNKKKKEEIENIKKGKPQEILDKAKDDFKEDKKVQALIGKFEKSYKKERQILNDRVSKTENLAAVGLSIETAAHDVMIFMKKTLESVDSLMKNTMLNDEVDKTELVNQLTMVRGNLSMIETQLKDVQLLFPSTKSRAKTIRVKDIVDKVARLYLGKFKENNIKYEIISTSQPLVAKTTDAVLLQVFINLFDNAFYWLREETMQREVQIHLDGENQRLVFSDSGPGIREEDKGYIFEAFYSGKGEEGRGLGLYIARQLLDRYDYTIDLAQYSNDKILDGANFVIEFSRGEE